jgi:ABC-type branched-subunit amino acid transport system ATPase component
VQTASTTGLELRGLVWAAGKSYGLDSDPLRVEPGSVGVVVADPAAGDALADVLIGLAEPCAGSVAVNGTQVTGWPAGQRPIALVPCGGGLLPHLTVERNVGFGLDTRSSRLARGRRVSEVLERLQLESLRRRRPHEISPVQRLRVAVARALCAAVEPVAVVIEDRQGKIPCRAAAVTAAAQDLAVLVITDTAERGGALATTTQATCRPLAGPGRRGQPVRAGSPTGNGPSGGPAARQPGAHRPAARPSASHPPAARPPAAR